MGQRLARTITEGTGIDTAAGTEHTEWVELESFSGSVTHCAVNKEEEAKETQRQSDGPGELSLWTDASSLDSGHVGTSVA